jgi:hypothetical protein
MTADIASAGIASAGPDEESVPSRGDLEPMSVAELAEVHLSCGRGTREASTTHEGGHTRNGEEQSIARVVESLVAAFPEVPEAHIRSCVDHNRALFAHARIRTYIPILVARQARAALANGAPSADGARSD